MFGEDASRLRASTRRACPCPTQTARLRVGALPLRLAIPWVALWVEGCALLMPAGNTTASSPQPVTAADPEEISDTILVQGISDARDAVTRAPGSLDPALLLADYVVSAYETGAVERGVVDGPSVSQEAFTALSAADGDAERAWAGHVTRGRLHLARGEKAEGLAALEQSLKLKMTLNALEPLIAELEAEEEAKRAHRHCRDSLNAASDDAVRYAVLKACAAARRDDVTPETQLPWATKKERDFFVEQQQQAGARRTERLANPAVGQSAPAPTSKSESNSKGKSAGSGSVSIRIRNECRESVSVFFGASPRSSGTQSSLGGNSSTSRRLRVGEGMWIMDGSRPGSGATISEGSRELIVDRSCGSVQVK